MHRHFTIWISLGLICLVSGCATTPASYNPATAGGSYPMPDYPVEFRNAHVQGKILLHASVAADGHPTVVEVKESSGNRSLDEHVVEKVKTWRWPKGKVREYLIPVEFSLSEDGKVPK